MEILLSISIIKYVFPGVKATSTPGVYFQINYSLSSISTVTVALTTSSAGKTKGTILMLILQTNKRQQLHHYD